MRVARTAVVVPLFLTSAAIADPMLGRYNLAREIGLLGASTHIVHSTFLHELGGEFSGQGTLFEDIVLFDGDVRVDTITLADDPEFAKYNDLVTDGLNFFLYDHILFSNGNMMSFFGFESQRLPFPWIPGPDLVGFTVTSVVRRLEVAIASPGSDPNGDGNWTDLSIRSVIEVYGVPAPSAALGLAFGLVGRRRR